MTDLKGKIKIHIKSAIESFVDAYLPSSPLRFPIANKVVLESLCGTQILYEPEIALLDTPLIQRLQQIHQTALVYLTYPSSTHTYLTLCKNPNSHWWDFVNINRNICLLIPDT